MAPAYVVATSTLFEFPRTKPVTLKSTLTLAATIVCHHSPLLNPTHHTSYILDTINKRSLHRKISRYSSHSMAPRTVDMVPIPYSIFLP